MKNIEVVTVHEEIKVVGLSYKKLGFPGTLESLEKMWSTYGEKYRNRVENAAVPLVDYGISACILTDSHEYITGCSVTEIGDLEENWESFIVPPGKYIKYAARKIETLFENLDTIRAWAKANKIKIYGDFEVEVYPSGAFEGKGVEVYILLPIQA